MKELIIGNYAKLTHQLTIISRLVELVQSKAYKNGTDKNKNEQVIHHYENVIHVNAAENILEGANIVAKNLKTLLETGQPCVGKKEDTVIKNIGIALDIMHRITNDSELFVMESVDNASMLNNMYDFVKHDIEDLCHYVCETLQLIEELEEEIVYKKAKKRLKKSHFRKRNN